MSTRSFVGTVNAGTGQITARYCHSDGYPTYQGNALADIIEAWRVDLDQLDTLRILLLSGDWSVLDRWIESSPVGHAEVIEGVGARYTDLPRDEPPMVFRVGDAAEYPFGYAITGTSDTDRLVVFGTDERNRVVPIAAWRFAELGDVNWATVEAVAKRVGRGAATPITLTADDDAPGRWATPATPDDTQAEVDAADRSFPGGRPWVATPTRADATPTGKATAAYTGAGIDVVAEVAAILRQEVEARATETPPAPAPTTAELWQLVADAATFRAGRTFTRGG